MLANRIKLNHSPKEHINGSSNKKDMLETLCISKDYMSRTLDVLNY